VDGTTAVATTAPLPPPPYPVATTTTDIVDPSRPTVSRGVTVSATRALATTVWMPTVGARWPLLLFASGFRVGPQAYRALCQMWAAAGYIVAAPSFPLADVAVAGAALDESDLDNEPADARFVIDWLTGPTSPLAGRIDATRVALAGHSDGAEVALAVAQQTDPAIRAVIAMSGQPVVSPQPRNPPLLAVQGDADTINPPARAQAVYDRADSPRYLLMLAGGDHLTPFAGGSRWQPVVDEVSVDFLNFYLTGDVAAGRRLLTAGNSPGVARLEAAP
jgi:dienelactone hydrolase